MGLYILISLVFVFGTMVEFAGVLIVKQRMDWNEKTMEKTIKVLNGKAKKSGNESKLNLKMNSAGMENKFRFLKPSHFIDSCKLTKDIPSYRKVDVLSFVLFSGFYICFNFIYFHICVQY